MPVAMYAQLLDLKQECAQLVAAWKVCFPSAVAVSACDGAWFRLADGEEASPLNPPEAPEMEEILTRAQAEGIVVEPRGSGHLVAIGAHGKIVLWGECEFTNHEAVVRLARATVTLAEQSREVADTNLRMSEFVQQVTTDFEELTWLRSLAECLVVCDVQNAAESVARAVLPTLKDLIQAESIAYLPPLETGSEPVLFGDATLRRADYATLCHDLANLVDSGPIVKNWKPHSSAPFSRLRNCILIPVQKGTEQFGFIFAINKMPAEHLCVAQSYLAHEEFDELEFGTFEASLVNAAAVMLATHARNIQLFREQEGLLIGIVRALINAIDAKDPYTCGHSDRVALMGRRIAEELQLSPTECERIYMAGLLHDIGKIGVPDSILQKPGKLTDEEYAEVKKHPLIGRSILEHLPQLKFVLPGVLHHHESIDGSGYPYGLKGNDIPLFGRILAVADAYDAMTSCRPYRDGMPVERAESILRAGAGQQWDAQVLDAFFAAKADIAAVIDYRRESTQALLHPELKAEENVCHDVRDAITAAVSKLHTS